MDFADFKAWFSFFDAQLDGKPPDLKQWWELKARLDVVDKPEIVMRHENINDSAPAPSIKAAKPPVSRETQFEDVDLASFADDHDGGITQQAVRTLREIQADLRPSPGARTPTP